MESRSHVLEVLLGEVERHLGHPHLVVADEADPVVGSFANEQSVRRVVRLPPDDGWSTDALAQVREHLVPNQPLLVLPPWDSKPRKSGESALGTAIRTILSAFPEHPTSLLVPARFLRSRRSRDREAALLAAPGLVVGLEEFGGDFGLHRLFTVGIVLLQREAEATRFFKLTGPTIGEDVRGDFRQLLQRTGGETLYGFVRRPAVAVDQPLWPDFWSPRLARKLEDVALVGNTAPLHTFAEVMILVHRLASGLRTGDGGIRLLSGRNISRSGELDIDEAPLVQVDGHQQLRSGDILIRVHQDLHRGPLVMATVEGAQLPATADQTVLVIRPRSELDSLQREFLLAFLQSSTAQAVLRARTNGPPISVGDLSELPVPTPDEATETAIGQLRDVREQLRGWADEAQTAVDELLQFAGQGTAQARTRLFAVSSTSQRRVASARLADDPAWQARTLYPHPIAFCLRTVEASRPNLEGYRECLRCAEMALAYVAFSILAVLQTDEGLRLPYASALSDRQRQRGMVRLSMGDFLQIVREFSGRENRSFARLRRWIPLEEVRESFTDDVDDAVARLKARRDSQAHFRDDTDREQAYREARAELDTLIGSLRFLTEYSLHLVEDVRVDSFTGETTYDRRELVGDHPLVPLRRGESYQGIVEPGSLYLEDRRGHLHLLRPFMLRAACPACGRPTTFHLDTYGSDSALYRSFEHGHTREGEDQLPALRAVGVIS